MCCTNIFQTSFDYHSGTISRVYLFSKFIWKRVTTPIVFSNSSHHISGSSIPAPPVHVSNQINNGAMSNVSGAGHSQQSSSSPFDSSMGITDQEKKKVGYGQMKWYQRGQLSFSYSPLPPANFPYSNHTDKPQVTIQTTEQRVNQ